LFPFLSTLIYPEYSVDDTDETGEYAKLTDGASVIKKPFF